MEPFVWLPGAAIFSSCNVLVHHGPMLAFQGGAGLVRPFHAPPQPVPRQTDAAFFVFRPMDREQSMYSYFILLQEGVTISWKERLRRYRLMQNSLKPGNI